MVDAVPRWMFLDANASGYATFRKTYLEQIQIRSQRSPSDKHALFCFPQTFDTAKPLNSAQRVNHISEIELLFQKQDNNWKIPAGTLPSLLNQRLATGKAD